MAEQTDRHPARRARSGLCPRTRAPRRLRAPPGPRARSRGRDGDRVDRRRRGPGGERVPDALLPGPHRRRHVPPGEDRARRRTARSRGSPPTTSSTVPTATSATRRGATSSRIARPSSCATASRSTRASWTKRSGDTRIPVRDDRGTSRDVDSRVRPGRGGGPTCSLHPERKQHVAGHALLYRVTRTDEQHAPDDRRPMPADRAAAGDHAVPGLEGAHGVVLPQHLAVPG